MTREEKAIKDIQTLSGLCKFSGDCMSCDICYNAVPKAIEALEKQIPKFVECKEWKGIRNTRYKCPYCGKNVRNDEKYCHKCGQAIKFPKLKKVDNRLELDWSEEDEET